MSNMTRINNFVIHCRGKTKFLLNLNKNENVSAFRTEMLTFAEKYVYVHGQDSGINICWRKRTGFFRPSVA